MCNKMKSNESLILYTLVYFCSTSFFLFFYLLVCECNSRVLRIVYYFAGLIWPFIAMCYYYFSLLCFISIQDTSEEVFLNINIECIHECQCEFETKSNNNNNDIIIKVNVKERSSKKYCNCILISSSSPHLISSSSSSRFHSFSHFSVYPDRRMFAITL
jgi:hypothetical protein